VTEATTRLQAGDVQFTRVPYFDIALDSGVVQMTRSEVDAIPWARPAWATADGQVLIGQAVWIAASGGKVAVIDPCGAADEFIRTGPEAVMHQDRVADAMRAAGFAPERVDVVVLSHLDGIGMAAAVDDAGAWRPMFPNARVVLTRAELEWLEDNDTTGRDALRALIAQGVVDALEDHAEVIPGLSIERTGGHSPGHAVLRAGTGADAVVSVGHLAVSPVQAGVVMPPAAHVDSELANKLLADLVEQARDDRSVLIGPLWPAPGAAKVGPAGGLVPV
jgi:glyoxylase-like metal-dependent hydrolase (beta-lactamase superfamily II)